MSWTDERVERLKVLWAEGMSASQIAADLGEVTRNAVIGKVHRLGLSGRVKAPAPAARPRKERPAPAPAAPVVVGALALKAEPAPVAAAEPEARPVAVAAPESRATILTINERSCKWPIGDPGRADFFFCGRASDPGSPYCQHHARLAYQPVQNRNRERKRA